MFISVTIEEKQALIGTSRLMLMIGAKDNQLKQWTVTDPQGYDTTVAVYNLEHDEEARSWHVQDRLHQLSDAEQLARIEAGTGAGRQNRITILHRLSNDQCGGSVRSFFLRVLPANFEPEPPEL